MSGLLGLPVTRTASFKDLAAFLKHGFQFCRFQSPNLLFMTVSQIFISHTHPWPINIVLEMAGQENGDKTKRWREWQIVKEAPVEDIGIGTKGQI